MFLNRNMKNLKDFYLKIYIFLVVKFSVYLYRLVFVMITSFGSAVFIAMKGTGLGVFKSCSIMVDGSGSIFLLWCVVCKTS